MVLGIDTSGPAGGAALALDGAILAEHLVNSPLTHSRRLMKIVEGLFAQTGQNKKDLTGIAVCRGPGFFTGLRIGLATAQGLALGLGIPVSGMSSLRLLAEGAVGYRGSLWAAIDARRGLIYAALFACGPKGVERQERDAAMTPTRLVSMIQPPALLVGSGALLYREELSGKGIDLAPEWTSLPRPGLLALLGGRSLAQGRGISPSQVRASYLRPSDAEIKFGLPLDEYRLLD